MVSGDTRRVQANFAYTPSIELYILYRKAHEIAERHGLRVVRNLVGFYFCSAVSRWQLARVSDERARGGGRR